MFLESFMSLQMKECNGETPIKSICMPLIPRMAQTNHNAALSTQYLPCPQ